MSGAASKAAQYLRMSSDSQQYSLGNQADVIRAYALLHGFEIVQSYEDAGRSGVTAEKRSGLAALLSDVVSGDVAYSDVLVLDVSRWGRYQDPDEAAHYEFMCRASGVNVHYCAEAFGEGYAGSIMKQLKRVMAGEYSRELSEKVKKGKRRQAELGNAPGGPCPFGLQRREFRPDGTCARVLARTERKSRPDHTVRVEPGCEAEVAIVGRIFRSYVHGGKNATAISRDLQNDGVMWSDGSPWTSCRVTQTLRMDTLAGRRLVGRTEQSLGKTRVNIAPENWKLINQFDPVVSPALFDAAQRRRHRLAGSLLRTDAELLRDLRRVWRKHGRISSLLIESSLGPGRSSNYFSRFGSLRSAYALIGYDCPTQRRPRRRPLPTRHEVISYLRRVQEDFGRVSVRLIGQDPELPSAYEIIKVFGSLSAAYAAAGVRGGWKGRSQKKPCPASTEE